MTTHRDDKGEDFISIYLASSISDYDDNGNDGDHQIQ
jgi:hypothetical protein